MTPDKTTQGSTGNNVGVIVAGAPPFGRSPLAGGHDGYPHE
ncbi:hypothetical protein [Nocardia salmonicida]|nr:hypothetical protein [Nocardia salmonicida]